MGRRARRTELEAARARIRNASIAFVLALVVIPMAWPLLAGRHRRLPFARTQLPSRAGSERPLVVQFSPDGLKVLVVSRDALRAYIPEDLARGDTPPLFTVDHSETGVTFDGAYDAAISGNGRELAIVRHVQGAAGESSELEVVAIERALLVQRIALEPVASLALSFNGMKALVGTSRAELWDLTTGKRTAALELGDGPVNGIHFSPDERKAVFGQPKKSRTMTWDLASQATRETHAPLEPAVFALDGGRVFGFGHAAGQASVGAELWDPERGESVAIGAGGHALGEVTDAARLGDGSRVVGISEQQVLVWNLDARELVGVKGGVKPELGRFACMGVAPPGDAVVIGTQKGELLWLDLGD